MLILARKPGDTIHIGKDTLLSVKEISHGQVRFEITAPINEIVSIGGNTDIRITQIENEQVKFGFIAPSWKKILRGELFLEG